MYYVFPNREGEPTPSKDTRKTNLLFTALLT